MHRRRLQTEEQEQRVRIEKDRMATIENRNVQMGKELAVAQEELRGLQKENREWVKEQQEMKE